MSIRSMALPLAIHGFSLHRGVGGGADAAPSDQLAQRFDCLSVTLEQPFKDAANAPDPTHGWSPQRAMVLGNHVVEAIAAVLPLVR